MAKPPANITPKSVAQPSWLCPNPILTPGCRSPGTAPCGFQVAGFDFLEVRTLVQAPDF
jgi:hypothetical protein